MRIWVYADACPNVIKDILFRAAERKRIALTLVANQFLRTPASRFITSVQVSGGIDVADSYIVEQLETEDLVITPDILLAAAVVAQNAHALNPLGEFYSQENIKERLATRDLMEELLNAGQLSGGPAAFGVRDKQDFAYMNVGKGREHDCMDAGVRATQEQLPRSGRFANALDRLLAKYCLNGNKFCIRLSFGY